MSPLITHLVPEEAISKFFTSNFEGERGDATENICRSICKCYAKYYAITKCDKIPDYCTF